MKTWEVIDATVRSEAREAAEYGLMEAGAVGTETRDDVTGQVNIAAYFDGPVSVEAARPRVLEALRIYGFEASELIGFQTRLIEDQDWLAEWKKHWQPVEVGRFIIAPPWFDTELRQVGVAGGLSPSVGEQILIRIEPGMAFGTGTHETTRLCLKAIDKYYAGGSFLDVGTGTGILAIAAAKLAPNAAITACDTDAGAVAIARENAQLNEVEKTIDFRVASVDDQTPSADLVCANLTAPVIVELLPALLGVTCGRLVLSGILESQFELVHARLVEQAATINEIIQDSEWLALVI